jgi:hypothetical protein
MKKEFPIWFTLILISILLIPFLRAGQEIPPSPEASALRYEIWAELDDANKMLQGKEEIYWTNRTQDVIPDMWFHLYWNAFKNEKSTVFEESREESLLGIRMEEGGWGWIDITRITLADGTDLMPTLEFVTPDTPPHPGDQTVVRVRLPEPIMPGQEVHLRLEFKSKIPRTVLRSGHYKNSYFIAQWFPKPGVYEEGKGWNCHEYHLNSEFFADFADFTVHITVPSPFVVGSSGKQVTAVSDEKEKTVTYTFQQNMIHDFAWTTDPDFIKVERDFIADREVSDQEYAENSQKLNLPLEDVKLPNVKMILLIEPEHKGQVECHFKALRMALKYYGLWYGPYPYETVTMVDPPFRTGSGGMEYPTLFTAGTGVLRDKKVLSPEGVIIHEFGHGYWYGLIANNEFEEAWLDEGINSYSTGKVAAKAYGPGIFSVSLMGLPLSWFLNLPKYYDYEMDRIGAIIIAERDPIVTHSWLFSSRMSYGANVYFRASTCLHTLERLLGEDQMLRILRTFSMRFRFKHPRTQDFVAVVNEVTGKDMTWFFEELFFNTLNFDYGISSLRSFEKKEFLQGIFDLDGKKGEITKKEAAKREKEKENKKEQKVYVTEVKLRRFGEARVRGEAQVKLRVLFEDGTEEVRYWDGQDRWEKFTFEKPAKAKAAVTDPDLVWLIDSNLANNSLKTKASWSGVFRMTAKVLFWIQNCLQCLCAIS